MALQNVHAAFAKLLNGERLSSQEAIGAYLSILNSMHKQGPKDDDKLYRCLRDSLSGQLLARVDEAEVRDVPKLAPTAGAVTMIEGICRYLHRRYLANKGLEGVTAFAVRTFREAAVEKLQSDPQLLSDWLQVAIERHSSTYQGHLKRSQGRLRPFILTRSFFVGSQRTAAEWGHLRVSVPMLLSLSVAGIPHEGADVGGFFKNVDEQLLVRWYQAGAFKPFFRAHAHIECKRREPWLFLDSTKAAIRKAVRQRYAFLPYWYTLFYDAR